jgi:dipeptidyl aminopeptidase/acylaminoacyl peptidase
LHHGDADDVVAVSQSESLIATMNALGREAPDFESYIYPGGTHSPLTLPGSISRAVEFLSALLGAGSGAGGQATAEP